MVFCQVAEVTKPYACIQFIVDFLEYYTTMRDVKYVQFTAQKDDDDRRLDRVLRKLLPSLSLPLIYKNIRTGFIRLNDKKTDSSTHVKNGDNIGIAEFLYSSNRINNAPAAVSDPFLESITLFKNEHIWVLHKPAGLPVQKSKKDERSLDDIVRNASAKGSSLSFSPGPLHRLDRYTSGIICFSQSLLGARWFSSAMQQNKLEKYYYGLAQGELTRDEQWKDGIVKNKNEQDFHTVSITQGNSITRAKPLSWGTYCGNSITLIEYTIIGGKTHQIRSQSAYHGFPLLGDSAYGGLCSKEISSFFLHAHLLILPDNELTIPVKIECPVPEKFRTMIKMCLPKTDTDLIL